MKTLFVADRNPRVQQEMAELFSFAGFHVVTAGSVVDILQDIRDRKTRVLLLGSELNGLPSVELIPLLRKCNRNLRIIVVADEIPPAADVFLSHDAVVYHGPPPSDAAGRNALLRAVFHAFSAGAGGPTAEDTDERR